MRVYWKFHQAIYAIMALLLILVVMNEFDVGVWGTYSQELAQFQIAVTTIVMLLMAIGYELQRIAQILQEE